MAHGGVIAALEDAGRHIDRLAGTSMGALSAMAMSPPEMRRVCLAELVLRRPFNGSTIAALADQGRMAPPGLIAPLVSERLLLVDGGCSTTCRSA